MEELILNNIGWVTYRFKFDFLLTFCHKIRYLNYKHKESFSFRWINQQKIAQSCRFCKKKKTKKEIVSKEVYFHFGDYVNKQNYCISVLEDPYVVFYRSLCTHLVRLVKRKHHWPYFFTNANWEQRNHYGNTDTDRTLITDFIFICSSRYWWEYVFGFNRILNLATRLLSQSI